MMNNQEIIDNAPEGATHIDNCGFYLKAGKSGFMAPDNLSNDWDYEYSNHSEVSSLADIKRIVELEKALDKLIDRAQQVDSWESFPESWIDEAYEALKEPKT
jgi:hypothetical protein